MKKWYLLLLVVALFGCNKKENNATATIKDYTGLDGCNWVIVLDKPDADGVTTLEPINLSQFNIALQNNQKVTVVYKKIDAASICMVGQTVSITNIAVVR